MGYHQCYSWRALLLAAGLLLVNGCCDGMQDGAGRGEAGGTRCGMGLISPLHLPSLSPLSPSFPPSLPPPSFKCQVDIDFATEPIGVGSNGQNVFLRDIWPTTAEVAEVSHRSLACTLDPDSAARWNAQPRRLLPSGVAANQQKTSALFSSRRQL